MNAPQRKERTMEGSRARVAILATEGVERVELEQPRDALRDAGFEAVLVSDRCDKVRTFDHLDRATTEPVDRDLASTSAEEYDALMLPGGVANPDRLRRDARAVAFVRHFFDADKPVAAICHAPWLIIESGAARGRSVTSWPSLRTDLVNAGASWDDREVVRDGNLVTSRGPDDLPAFCAAMLELFRLQPSAQPQGGLDEALEDSHPASDPVSAGPSTGR
jgi:protease I